MKAFSLNGSAWLPGLALVGSLFAFSCLQKGGNPSETSEVRLLATLKIPGDSKDLSGQNGTLETGIPVNLFGGWGSGLDRGAQPTEYWVISDRGPADGASSYQDRLHRVRLAFEEGKIQFELQETLLLKDSQGRDLVGDKSAKVGSRFDPEAIRFWSKGPDSRLWVSDEYGPELRAFDLKGRQVGQITIPEHYQIANPSADPEKEKKDNSSGRNPNRGFEGLALDGAKGTLIAALQGPLIQDEKSPLNPKGSPGTLLRFLVADPVSGQVKGEYLYPMDDPSHGVNEILHWEKGVFLVLERDSKAGVEAKTKRIYRVDLDQATLIPSQKTLPEGAEGKGAILKKKLLVDLTKLGIEPSQMPAKWEGIARGPDLPGGKRLLWVTSDNDFQPKQPSWILALEVPANP